MAGCSHEERPNGSLFLLRRGASAGCLPGLGPPRRPPAAGAWPPDAPLHADRPLGPRRSAGRCRGRTPALVGEAAEHQAGRVALDHTPELHALTAPRTRPRQDVEGPLEQQLPRGPTRAGRPSRAARQPPLRLATPRGQRPRSATRRGYVEIACGSGAICATSVENLMIRPGCGVGCASAATYLETAPRCGANGEGVGVEQVVEVETVQCLDVEVQVPPVVERSTRVPSIMEARQPPSGCAACLVVGQSASLRTGRRTMSCRDSWTESCCGGGHPPP